MNYVVKVTAEGDRGYVSESFYTSMDDKYAVLGSKNCAKPYKTALAAKNAASKLAKTCVNIPANGYEIEEV